VDLPLELAILLGVLRPRLYLAGCKQCQDRGECIVTRPYTIKIQHQCFQVCGAHKTAPDQHQIAQEVEYKRSALFRSSSIGISHTEYRYITHVSHTKLKQERWQPVKQMQCF
jgi:hypothetical protein